MNAVEFRRCLAVRARRLLPRTGVSRRALAANFARVRASDVAVQAALGEIESRFLTIGGLLETTTGTGRELVENCEALISLALGQGGGEVMIETAAGNIWQGIEFAEKNGSRMDALVGRLADSNNGIKRTLAMEADLHRTLAPLNFIKTLFRVESAALPADVQEMFAALVREIERIHARVAGGFREKFQLLAQVQSILDQAVSHLTLRQTEARQALAGVRAHLTKSLATMKESHEKNRDRDARLSGVSQAVSTETGRVVMSLQFQDIIAQKLQHMRGVLGQMESTYATVPRNRTAGVEALRFIEQSGRVVVGQLTAMEQELSTAGQSIGGGLQQILHQMGALDSDCLALRDLDSVTAGVDGAVQILLDSVAEMRELIARSSRHAREAHTAIEPTGGMTSNFTVFMRELSLEIQLIGLNAQVQAAHVGHGTGLEVLSAHTSSISGETSRLSDTLARALDELIAGLTAVVTAFREISDENDSFASTSEAKAVSDETKLHHYRDSSLNVLMQISQLLPRLEAETRAAIDQADFSAVATDQLQTLKAEVRQLAEAAGTLADCDGTKVETDGLTDRFIQSYTMRSEVENHHRVLGMQAEASAVPPPAATGDCELFGEPETPAPASADNVDLWGEGTPQTEVVTRVGSKDTA